MFGGVFNFGNAGVDFFFVLSGFIIFFVHGKDVGQPSRLPAYLWSRLTRIYPPYWFVTAIVVALAVVAHHADVLEPVYLLKSIFLIPQAHEPALQVGWTLVFEMLFYIGFAVAVASRIAARAIAIAWIVLIVATTLFLTQDSPVYNVASYQIEFAIGVATAFAVRQWQFSHSAVLVILGAALFVFVAYLLDTQALAYVSITCRYLLGLASALIIYGAARLEIEGRLKIGVPAAFLGSASYSIYLVHTIAIGLFARLLVPTRLMILVPNAGFLMTVLVAVSCGCALYLIVERPMLRLAKRHAPMRSAPRPAQQENTLA